MHHKKRVEHRKYTLDYEDFLDNNSLTSESQVRKPRRASNRESPGKTQFYTITCINITSYSEMDSVLRDRLHQNDVSRVNSKESEVYCVISRQSMKMSLQTLFVLSFVVLTAAGEAYENNLTKLWSLSSASNSDGSVNVTSTSIVIQPSREARINKYAFKPRAIPLIRDEPSNYYSQEVKYQPKMLFSGNYMPIAKEKGNKNLSEPIQEESFHPRAIPLIRSQEFQSRSLDEDEEPTIEKPEGFTEQTASRRSISYMLGLDEEDPEEEEEEEEEGEFEEEAKGGKKKIKKPKLKLKPGKLKKYVVPLLMAYKMKYFALVPVLIGGLILLVGATGLAGFFFALFAAVMGLQKGAY